MPTCDKRSIDGSTHIYHETSFKCRFDPKKVLNVDYFQVKMKRTGRVNGGPCGYRHKIALRYQNFDNGPLLRS